MTRSFTWRLLMVTALCVIAVSPTPAGQAVEAQDRDLVSLDTLVARGDLDAMFMLGLMHEAGHGVLRNLAEAVRLLQRAATSGHASSKVQLGLMYQTGAGVTKDPSRARELFAEAAQAGHAEGEFRLAMAFIYGVGTAADPVEARRWLSAAAEQGHQEAQLVLGIMLQAGNGGPQNEFAARRWLLQAANGQDREIADKARPIANKISERVLFSGAFRPEAIATFLVAAASFAALMSKMAPEGAAVHGASSTNDPMDPYNYSMLAATKRKERCFQSPTFGSTTLNGRAAIMSSPGTFRKCVEY